LSILDTARRQEEQARAVQTHDVLQLANKTLPYFRSGFDKTSATYEDGTILPAQAVVVVMGKGGSGYYHDNLVAIANSLNEAGSYSVLAGNLQAAGEGGVIDTLRQEAADEDDAEAISTVDSINRDFSQLAVVLAVVEQLEGGSGAYGASEAADTAAPPLP